MLKVNAWMRLSLAAITGLGAVFFWNNPENIWVPVIAVLLVNLRIENSFLKNQLYVISIGLIAIGIVYTASLFSMQPFLLASFLFIAVLIGIYWGFKNKIVLLPAFFIILLAILSGLQSVSDSVERLLAMLVGLMIAIAVRLISGPFTFYQMFREYYADYLDALQALQEELFILYLQRDYLQKKYDYERKLHLMRFALLDSINKLRALTNNMPPQQANAYVSVLKQLDRLAEDVIALGSLRYRLKDFATLEVCEKELKASTYAIGEAIKALKLNCLNDVNTDSVIAFETMYQTTLQVVTNNPWIFLVFIQTIKTLLADLRLTAECMDKT